jgi:hypothetical protein
MPTETNPKTVRKASPMWTVAILLITAIATALILMLVSGH